jgi:hypothetical protein
MRLAVWLTPTRRLSLAMGLMMLPLLLWGMSTLASLQGGSFFSKTSGDFSAFYMAGHFLLEGRVDDLYNFGAQEQFQRAWSDYDIAGALVFISPPFAAILFAPLALLPPFLALFIWRLIGIVVLYYSIKLIQSEFSEILEHKASRLLLVCFLFYPTLHWLMLGQATSIVLFLYTACFVYLRRKQDFKAGFFLGLLLFKPQLGLWPALLLCYHRRWWALLGGLLAASLWLIVGFLMSPVAMKSFFYLSPDLFNYIRREAFHTWGLMSLYGFGAVLLDSFSRTWGGWLGWSLTGMVGLLFVSFWYRTPWEPKSKSWDLLMAASFALAPILSPHLFAYDLMLLLLPFAILCAVAPELWQRPTFLLSTSLLWLAALCTLYLSALTLYYFHFGIQWATLFVVWWAWMISRQARAQALVL